MYCYYYHNKYYQNNIWNVEMCQTNGPFYTSTMCLIEMAAYYCCFLQATCKYERKIASLRTQQQYVCKRLKEAETRFLDNDGWLHRVENDLKLLKSNDQPSEVSNTTGHIKFIAVFG